MGVKFGQCGMRRKNAPIKITLIISKNLGVKRDLFIFTCIRQGKSKKIHLAGKRNEVLILTNIWEIC